MSIPCWKGVDTWAEVMNIGWERSYDHIHTALHNALAEAGIEIAIP